MDMRKYKRQTPMRCVFNGLCQCGLEIDAPKKELLERRCRHTCHVENMESGPDIAARMFSEGATAREIKTALDRREEAKRARNAIAKAEGASL